MATSKFNPTIWTASILATLDSNLIGFSFVNFSYEGEIQGAGDTVEILSLDEILVEDYDGSDFVPQELNGDDLKLVIDKAKLFAFVVGDIEKYQSKPNLLKEASMKAANGVKKAVDTDIMTHLAANYYVDNLIDTIVLTKSNIYDTLVDASTALSDQDVPEDNRNIALSPAEVGLILKADEFIKASALGDSVVQKGRKGFQGQIAGFNIFMTTNLKVETAADFTYATVSRARDASNVATIVTATAHGLTSGDTVQVSGLGGTGYNTSSAATVTVVNATTFTYSNTGDEETTAADTDGSVLHLGVDLHRYIPFGHNYSTTFARQINNVETARTEKNFKDLVKGLTNYGMKTIMSKALGCIMAKIGETEHS